MSTENEQTTEAQKNENPSEPQQVVDGGIKPLIRPEHTEFDNEVDDDVEPDFDAPDTDEVEETVEENLPEAESPDGSGV